MRIANPEANAIDPPTAASNAIDEPPDRVPERATVVAGEALVTGAIETGTTVFGKGFVTAVDDTTEGGGNVGSAASLDGGGNVVDGGEGGAGTATAAVGSGTGDAGAVGAGC